MKPSLLVRSPFNVVTRKLRCSFLVLSCARSVSSSSFWISLPITLWNAIRRYLLFQLVSDCFADVVKRIESLLNLIESSVLLREFCLH